MTAVQRLLRSILREPRVPGAPPPSRRDAVLVALAEAGIVVEVLLRPDMPWRWPMFVLAVLLVPVVAWRRVRPLLAVSVSFGAMAVVSAADLVAGLDQAPGHSALAVLLLTLYAVCRWGSGREGLIGSGIAAATSLIAVAAELARSGRSDTVGGVAVIAITIAVALAVRFRGRARLREVEQVRLVEREHLARDLHDTVAHHVSAIAISAQAGLAVAAARPEAALEALRVIEIEASRTLAEMRAMVGVLRRDGGGALAPTPTIADVARFARSGGDGPAVVVAVPADSSAVPAHVSTAAYRIVQEAVTNAVRHARRATRIDVEIAVGPDDVRLAVRDDGAPAPSPSVDDGYGVRGMAERAELLGGRCTAGADSRGWTVAATLPFTPGTPAGAGR